MQPTTDTDYKELFTQLIKKQMLVLGPDITLAKVRNVPGLTVDPSGTVQSLEGEPQAMLQALINQFVELSGMIVKKTMESILTSYPGMMGLAATPMINTPSVQNPTTNTPVVTQMPIQPEVVAPKVEPVVEPEKPRQEPPSMASMTLESLVPVDTSKKEEKPEPKSFSQDEMDSLNKALEDLAKAPLTTENQPQSNQSPQ